MSTASTSCPACGSVLVPGAPFCGACGASSRGIAAMPEPILVPAAAPVPTVVAIPTVVPATVVPIPPVVAIPTASPTRAALPTSVPLRGAEPAGSPGAPLGSASAAPAILPRVVALVVDQALAGLAAGATLLVVSLVAGWATGSATGGAVATSLLLPGVVATIVQVGQWIWEGRTGKTVGNLALHLRTVSATTGRPAGFGSILLRQVIQGLGALACFVGVYVVAASGAWDSSGRRQGWHDKIAGTLVVTGRPAGRVDQVAREAVPTTHQAAVGVPAPMPAPDRMDGSDRMDAPDRPAPQPWSAPTGIISAVPGFTASVPRPVPAAQAISAQRPVPAPPVPAQLPVPPRARVVVVDEPDDLDETRLSSAATSGAPETVLTFDTGEIVHVAGDGVVGRNPAPPAGATVVHRVCIPDRERSVSKTHLGFGLDVGGLWVADLGSTNGSVLIGADGVRTTLEAGVHAHVTRGTVVQIGDHSFRVETP